MNWIDGFIILYLIVVSFVGVIRGFIYEVFGWVALLGGAILAMILAPAVGSILSSFLPGDQLPRFLAYVLVFGAVYMTAQVVSVISKSIIEKIKLQKFDRLAGGVAGFLKGLCITILISVALIAHPVQKLSTAVAESTFYNILLTDERINHLKQEFQEKAPGIKEDLKGLIEKGKKLSSEHLPQDKEQKIKEEE